MTAPSPDDGDETPAIERVCDALADADCRRILAALDEPLAAQEVAERCDLPQTSTYRKLETLSDVDLVEERTEVRSDGHHTARFVRDVTGVVVEFDDGRPAGVEIVSREDRADQRLAHFWERISEEL